MTRIDTIEQWQAFAAALRADRYTPFCYQYSATDPEGLRVTFVASQYLPLVEIVTHNPDVAQAIDAFR